MSSKDQEASISMIDLESYSKLSESERKEKIKKLLQNVGREQVDPLDEDIPPMEREYLND